MTKDILQSLNFRLGSIKDHFGTLTDIEALNDENGQDLQSRVFESFTVSEPFWEADFDDKGKIVYKRNAGDLVEVMETLLKQGYPKNFKNWQKQIAFLKKLRDLQLTERARFEKWCSEIEATGKSEEVCSESIRLENQSLEIPWEFIWAEMLKCNDGDKTKTKAEFKEQKHLTYFIFNRKISAYVNESYQRAMAKQAA